MMGITDVLGRTREIKGEVYPDGSYSCPFCAAAVVPSDFSGSCRGWRTEVEGLHCHNPACPANPHLDPEPMRLRVEEQERRQAEREADARRHERHMEYLRQDKETRNAKWNSLAAEARERGACVTCLNKSTWEYGTPKFIRHRAECPRGR